MNIGTNQITTTQTFAILGSTLVAVGSFTFPRALATDVGTPDMWMSVILGGLITFLSGLFVVKLSQQFPKQTFFQFNQIIVGKYLGWGLSLGFIIYAILLGSFEIRAMGEVTKFYLLEGTPLSVLMICMLWVGTYLLAGGINAMARLFEFIYPITIFIFLLVVMLGIVNFEIDNVRPVLGNGVMPIIKGLVPTLLTNSGMEFLLVWIAFMKRPKQATKVLRWGVFLTVFIYFFTIIITTGVFSVERLQVETWPTLSLIQSYEFKGVFIERFESVFLVVWIIQIFATYAVCHYIAALGVADIFKLKFKKTVYFLLPILYVVALAPSDLNQLSSLGSVIGYISLSFSLVIPIFLLIITKLRGLKK
ncbi:GerAB/ArcD/ProY family transporter [Paraliobacillus ryukyuensis]|uniref:GerAB/ArcD/ProY family transporter n=1 Tax=Paraliobacillus ryukyuensis TaxID=200904 RepID=UPI0009A8668D|nr:GerAB/ArcD/ProY family transporter [Paraliobacillus ryukyuensis]